MQSRRKTARRARAALALAVGLWLGPDAAAADEAGKPPAVGLDQLLQIPDAMEIETDRRGGATPSEWRARFREAEADLETARRKLADSQSELEELAAGGDTWQLAAPGAQPSPEAASSPMSYRLRQEIRRNREDVERAERRLQELRVEANLAGVPAEWQAGSDD